MRFVTSRSFSLHSRALRTCGFMKTNEHPDKFRPRLNMDTLFFLLLLRRTRSRPSIWRASILVQRRTIAKTGRKMCPSVMTSSNSRETSSKLHWWTGKHGIEVNQQVVFWWRLASSSSNQHHCQRWSLGLIEVKIESEVEMRKVWGRELQVPSDQICSIKRMSWLLVFRSLKWNWLSKYEKSTNVAVSENFGKRELTFETFIAGFVSLFNHGCFADHIQDGKSFGLENRRFRVRTLHLEPNSQKVGIWSDSESRTDAIRLLGLQTLAEFDIIQTDLKPAMMETQRSSLFSSAKRCAWHNQSGA
jgi:hypothetical protein